jgi:Tfp pilus assembly protein PilO
MSWLKNSSDPARLLWLLAAMVLAAGVLFVVKPAEDDLSATDARADTLLQQSLDAEEALKNRARVQAAAAHIRQELASVTLHGNASQSIEALLGDVQAVAERDSLAVSSLKPTTSFQPVPLASPAASTSSNPFDAAQTDDFDISVRGSYRDIVSFLRDLSHMPTLTRVVSAQLDRSSTGDALDGTPLLDATIHIQTLRLDPTTLQ